MHSSSKVLPLSDVCVGQPARDSSSTASSAAVSQLTASKVSTADSRTSSVISSGLANALRSVMTSSNVSV